MRNLFLLAIFFLLAPAGAAAQNPIKIGATLPLTGFGASWGSEALQGIEMAVDEINSSGGISGRQLKVIPEDFGQFDLARAAGAAHKFVGSDGVSAILTMWSEDTEVVWPIARAHEVPVLSIAAGKKGLTAGRPFLTRVWPSDECLIEALLKYAQGVGSRKAAVIFEQSAYHESLADLISQGWKREFGSMPLRLPVTQGTADVTALLLKVKSFGADTLFLQTSNGILGLLLKQAKTLNLKLTFFGVVNSDDPVTKMAAGSAIDGLIFPKYAPAGRDFQRRFQARYGKKPQIAADAAYDAVMVLAGALKKAGLKGAAIDAALRTVQNFPGATGLVTIAANGERTLRQVEVFQFQGMEARRLE